MVPFSISSAGRHGRSTSGFFGLGFRRDGLAQYQHPGPVHRDAQDRHDDDQPLEASNIPVYHLELLTENVAERHHDRHRYQRSEQIVEQKHSRAHTERSRRQINQRAQTGQESSVKNRAMPMTLHEPLDALDLMLAARPSQRKIADQSRAEAPAH